MTSSSARWVTVIAFLAVACAPPADDDTRLGDGGSTSADAIDAAPTGDGGGDDGDGGDDPAEPIVGHAAYMAACGAGYAWIGSLSGLDVCESPRARTTVLTIDATCAHGERVGDYDGPYYESVCAFDGHLGVAQFADGCPAGLTELEPSANGTVSCGKVGVQLFWRAGDGCPSGWTDAGPGLGIGHICRRDQVGSLIYLAGACPGGWETVDGTYCASAADELVATMSTRCPRGWDDLGSGGGGTHVCRKP